MGGFGKALGRIVGDVVSFIGRPFGIYTHDETFTDLQVSNLLTPGAADKSARKNAKYSAFGSSQQYLLNYRAFQKDYRRKYSKKFLQNLGYDPSSTAETTVATKELTETYLESLYGYAEVDVQLVKDTYLTITQKGNHAVQQLAGYDFVTGDVTISGKKYLIESYASTGNEAEVAINLRRYYDETIIENLTVNYAYDGAEVTINEEQYTVGPIVDAVNTNDQYETVCTHTGDPQLPDEVILTPVERLQLIQSNPRYATEVSYAEYTVLSGEVGTELRYWIEYADIATIYDRVTVDVTAIIPLKEDNVMVDLEARKPERMLRRLNLSGEQLRSSISNPDMDSAYLLTGIDPKNTDEVHTKVLFMMFDLMAPGSGNVKIAINKLSMRYTFNIVKSTKTGVVGAVGSYTRTDQTAKTMTLRYQGNSTQYRELVITEFAQNYTVSKGKFTADFGSSGGYCRLVIPLDLYNSLVYKDWVVIYEKSLCLLAYATETVEVKWYESGAFGTLLKIVGFVLSVFTFGLAAAIAITIVATLVVKVLIKILGPKLGIIVAAIAMVALGLYTGVLPTDLADNWLILAEKALSTMTQVIQLKTEELMVKGAEELERIAKDTDELKEKLKEMEDGTNIFGFDSAYAGTPNDIFASIDGYCNSIINTSVESLMDYGEQIEYAINVRTTVWTGP